VACGAPHRGGHAPLGGRVRAFRLLLFQPRLPLPKEIGQLTKVMSALAARQGHVCGAGIGRKRVQMSAGWATRFNIEKSIRGHCDLLSKRNAGRWPAFDPATLARLSDS